MSRFYKILFEYGQSLPDCINYTSMFRILGFLGFTISTIRNTKHLPF